MLFSSLNTGSTDLRDTEVQQPNTAATLSCEISSRAFSANSGQLEAGSTTTASSFLPSRPPFLFCSSMSMSIDVFERRLRNRHRARERVEDADLDGLLRRGGPETAEQRRAGQGSAEQFASRECHL